MAAQALDVCEAWSAPQAESKAVMRGASQDQHRESITEIVREVFLGELLSQLGALGDETTLGIQACRQRSFVLVERAGSRGRILRVGIVVA